MVHPLYGAVHPFRPGSGHRRDAGRHLRYLDLFRNEAGCLHLVPAEGSTAGGMETWVLVQNPGTSPSAWTSPCKPEKGRLAPAALQNVNIPGASRVSFRLNDYCQTYDVPPWFRLGPVVAERATYGPGREWAHDSVGVSAPAVTWCLAEGSNRRAWRPGCWYRTRGCLRSAWNLTLQTGEGALAPAALQNVNIPGARASPSV